MHLYVYSNRSVEYPLGNRLTLRGCLAGKEDKDTERDKASRSDALEDMEADKALPLGRRPQVLQ